MKKNIKWNIQITNVTSIGTYQELQKLLSKKGYKRRRMILTDISILYESYEKLIESLSMGILRKNDVLLTFKPFKILNGMEYQLFTRKVLKLNDFLVKHKLDIIIIYAKKDLTLFDLQELTNCVREWYLIAHINFDFLLHFNR